MKDLIDRQALLEWFKNWSDYDEFSVGYITGVIEDEPSADAVEVVRCKDCKSFSHGYCKFHDAKFVREDGYCYWGERKNDHNTCKI